MFPISVFGYERLSYAPEFSLHVTKKCPSFREFVNFLIPSPRPFPIPLPVQRLSIFSILRPERAKKLSIGVHGFEEKQRKSTASVQGEGKRYGGCCLFCNRRDARVRQRPVLQLGCNSRD